MGVEGEAEPSRVMGVMMGQNDLPQRKRPAHVPPVERNNAPVILFVTLTVQPRGDHLASDMFHTVFLEACRDADASVVAPTCGYYADQGPVLTFGFDEDRFDEGSLRDAIVRAHDERPDHRVTVEERRAQREHVARLHERLYRSLA